jgi:DnaJ family protein C protein 13
VQTVVGMLREVIDSEHEVFVFKLVMFLLAAVNNGKMENVTRLIRAGGAAVLVPLVVLSVDKVCILLLVLCQEKYMTK